MNLSSISQQNLNIYENQTYNDSRISFEIINTDSSKSFLIISPKQTFQYSERNANDANVIITEDIGSAYLEIPLQVLRDNSSLEAIVLYLKEVKQLRFTQISKILNRDQRTVWNTYTNAKKKNNTKKKTQNILEQSSGISDIVPDFYNLTEQNIPLSIFSRRSLSVLESIVFYLKSNSTLSFKQISKILGKDYQTVWTVYTRSIAKLKNE